MTWDVIISIIHLVPLWNLPLASETRSPPFNLLKSVACLCPQSFFIVWMAEAWASRRVIKGSWVKDRGLQVHSKKHTQKNCLYIYTFIHFTDADVVTYKSRGGQRFCSDIWPLCFAICYYVPLLSFPLKITYLLLGIGFIWDNPDGYFIKCIYHIDTKMFKTEILRKSLSNTEVTGGTSKCYLMQNPPLMWL